MPFILLYTLFILFITLYYFIDKRLRTQAIDTQLFPIFRVRLKKPGECK